MVITRSSSKPPPKPPDTPLNFLLTLTRLCSSCKHEGHNITTCPLIKQVSIALTSVSSPNSLNSSSNPSYVLPSSFAASSSIVSGPPTSGLVDTFNSPSHSELLLTYPISSHLPPNVPSNTLVDEDCSSLASFSITQEEDAANIRVPVIDTQASIIQEHPFTQETSYVTSHDWSSNNVTSDVKNRRKYHCRQCGAAGHNINTCPIVKKAKAALRSAENILKNAVSVDAESLLQPENNVSDSLRLCDDHDVISDVIFSPNESSTVCCPFCMKEVNDIANGRPLLFCRTCKAVDPLRPPVRIPVEVSPSSSIPLSLEVRSFTTKRNNKWDISSFWKFFTKKKTIITRRDMPPKKSQLLRKLCLRERYGSAVKSLFSSDIAKPNAETLENLEKLHPKELFSCPKPSVCQFWIDNPVSKVEVLKAIQKLPQGKAAGLSGLSFDLLKSSCEKSPEIADDLASYFHDLLCLRCDVPEELKAARLTALVKPGSGSKPSGIRPIAAGESIARLFASIVFNRVVQKAGSFLSPFQFGIQTIDGASVAALTSDLFFNSCNSNFIFNLDFKNAFNYVSRVSIYDSIVMDFPELLSFFYHFYGKSSKLVFDSHCVLFTSGVKQGDPLGPLLFCLAIHNTLVTIQSKYPSVRIVGYMDDISLIGPLELLKKASSEVSNLYASIGLFLNPEKCFLIGRETETLLINEVSVPFVNYSSDAFRFLGCWLGNSSKVLDELQKLLSNINFELDAISRVVVEKHI
ncbi:hypothetical protein RCL1_008383 [Eukaryota sp. TZLM3-RCL]